MEIKNQNNQKNKPLIVRLNKKFYDTGAVKETLNSFRGVCSGKVLESNDRIEVFLQPKKNVPMLKEEFCNYALGLMKNKSLV